MLTNPPFVHRLWTVGGFVSVVGTSPRLDTTAIASVIESWEQQVFEKLESVLVFAEVALPMMHQLNLSYKCECKDVKEAAALFAGYKILTGEEMAPLTDIVNDETFPEVPKKDFADAAASALSPEMGCHLFQQVTRFVQPVLDAFWKDVLALHGEESADKATLPLTIKLSHRDALLSYSVGLRAPVAPLLNLAEILQDQDLFRQVSFLHDVHTVMKDAAVLSLTVLGTTSPDARKLADVVIKGVNTLQVAINKFRTGPDYRTLFEASGKNKWHFTQLCNVADGASMRAEIIRQTELVLSDCVGTWVGDYQLVADAVKSWCIVDCSNVEFLLAPDNQPLRDRLLRNADLSQIGDACAALQDGTDRLAQLNIKGLLPIVDAKLLDSYEQVIKGGTATVVCTYCLYMIKEKLPTIVDKEARKDFVGDVIRRFAENRRVVDPLLQKAMYAV